MFKAILSCILCALALAWSSSQALAFEFSLLPGGGAASGPAGSTVGWGYSITNTDPQNWLVTNWSFATSPLDGTLSAPAGGTMTWGYSITNPDPLNWLMLSGLSADAFLNGTPDASVFDLPIIAPNSTVSGNLYQFTWDPTAPMDGINSGIFTLTADWYDEEFNFLDGAPNRSAYYMASVAPVPEPSAWLLFGVGLAGLGLYRRCTKHFKIKGR